MTVNRIILIAAISIAFVFILSTSFIMTEVIESGFRQLEIQKAESNSLRLVRFFDEQVEQLFSKNSDWSTWDDLYDFAVKPTDEFVNTNLTQLSLDALQISGVVIADANQKFMAGFVENETARTLPSVPVLYSLFHSKIGAFTENDLDGEKKGFSTVNGVPILIAARSIRKATLEGKSAGTLYFFVVVSDSLLKKAEEAIGVTIDAEESVETEVSIDEIKNVPPRDTHFFSVLSNPAALVTKEDKLAKIYLSILENDFRTDSKIANTLKSPAMKLRIEYSRDIMQLGSSVSMIVKLMVLGLTVTSWVLFYLIVRLLVIRRLNNFKETLNKTDGTDSDLIQHLNLQHSKSSQNEIDELGTAFSGLLERVILAEQLREKAHMESMHSSKLAALGEMAGGIAHEINNPLTVISGRARQLKILLDNKSLTPEKAATVIESIERTSERIARIVKSLRTHSRSGDHDPFIKTEVKSIIDGVLELCRDQIREKGIELSIDVTPVNAVLVCKEVQVGQVILNLVKNAIDAVEFLKDADRWIKIEFTSGSKSQSPKLFVSNGGPVINESLREKMFQPFFTTKPVGKGTGLGLSLSAEIMKQHRGVLSIDVECKNTRFIMKFMDQRDLETNTIKEAV
jgi:signal transduction histidine kinase/sensor domain CHASE-containing protein